MKKSTFPNLSLCRPATHFVTYIYHYLTFSIDGSNVLPPSSRGLHAAALLDGDSVAIIEASCSLGRLWQFREQRWREEVHCYQRRPVRPLASRSNLHCKYLFDRIA